MSKAIIVGSGVAGSFIAQMLLQNEQFNEVVMLEAGNEIPMGEPKHWFDFVATGRTPYQNNYDTSDDFSTDGINPWNIVGGRVMGSGGTTLHWGGWVPRFKPEDFKYKTNTGMGIDWPFDYNEFEPYYGLAENYIGVSGDSNDQSIPRSSPYPFVAAPYPIAAQPFINAFENLGYEYGHLPMARYGSSLQGSGVCRTTGTCDYCPVGGRFTGNQPLAKLAGNSKFTLILNAAVVEIVMDSSSVASGVTYKNNSSGESETIQGDQVFLCGGSFETPKLLLASTSSSWPNGIGNQNDLVGRFLAANAFFFVNGNLPNPDKVTQELGFPSLVSRQFDTEAEQATAKLFLTMNYGKPFLNLATEMAKGTDRSNLNQQVVGPSNYQLYGNVSPLSDYDNCIKLANGVTRFGMPKTLISTPKPARDQDAFERWITLAEGVLENMGASNITSGNYPQRGDHASCTTRMASSDSDGVVGPDHKVFGTDNLFVLSNAVLPTLPAANPTLTMVGMGFRMLDVNGFLPDTIKVQADDYTSAPSK